VAEMAPTRTGTRLVAFAVTGSSPIIMRTGSETADPDDAIVFRKPQASPAAAPSVSATTS